MIPEIVVDFVGGETGWGELWQRGLRERHLLKFVTM